MQSFWAHITETHGGFKSTWCVAPEDSANAAEDEEVLRQGGVVAGNSSFKAARAEGETNVLWGRSWVEPQLVQLFPPAPIQACRTSPFIHPTPPPALRPSALRCSYPPHPRPSTIRAERFVESKVMPEALIPSLAVGQSSIREFAEDFLKAFWRARNGA